MARSLAAVRGRPQPPHRPTVGRLCILQPTRRCTAPARERDPTMQKERRAAMANAYTLQCNRELTYAFETGARPPTPAPVLLIARCLWIAP